MSTTLAGGLALTAVNAVAQNAEPPVEWTEPVTGHRVVRLSREAGSQSLYFHQNAYSPDGQKLIMTTPSGLATINLKTQVIEKIVAGRVNVIVTGRKSGLVYYVKDRVVFATHLDTKETREIARLPLRGLVASVNADETLLLGSMMEGDTQSSYLQGPAPDAPRPQPAEVRGSQGQTLTFAEQKEVRLNNRLTLPNVNVALTLGLILPVALLGPIVWYPFSKTLWMAIDRAYLQRMDRYERPDE